MDLNTIHRYLSGEATNEERQTVEKWIAQRASNNRHYFEFLKKIWETELERPLDFNSEEGLEKIRKQLTQYDRKIPESCKIYAEKHKSVHILDIEETNQEKQSAKKDFNFRFFYKIAAVFLVGIIGIGIIFQQSVLQTAKKSDKKYTVIPQAKTYETVRGEIGEFVLTEDIEVKMNASSSLEIYSDAKMDRVTLEGEAFFDVNRNDAREFVVESNKITINVIGTSFNVKYRPKLQASEIVVRKGQVKIDIANEDSSFESVLLGKGERLIYIEKDSKYWTQQEVNVDDLLLWMDGGLYFENIPLSDVLTSLEHRYDVDFIINKSAPLNRPFSARFTNEALPEILQITALSLGFEYEKIEEGLFEIYNSSYDRIE